MKNILKLTTLFFLFAFSAKAYSQLDTLNYVKQFELNKANYIGHPFSKLLNDMTQIEPQTANSIINIPGKDLVADSLFDFTERDYQYGRETIAIYITWQTPISHSQAMLLSKQNHFLFTNDEKLFYGSKIVGDIIVSKK